MTALCAVHIAVVPNGYNTTKNKIAQKEDISNENSQAG